ncbi:phage portal protein [Campylobacter suis]|uniref:Phage portal protein n=1 Tax=Campylobacter suis TaxID=2790657 RepID=A0ABM8Q5T8_9BACT|nr:phage portal protein [Campylobacter suis]CAD7288240.1 hypothetical protein LMG8286_01208 [Campylobacter suis]
MLNIFKKQKQPKKRVFNFFRWHSLSPNEANASEIYSLGVNTDPDLASARLRNQARSLSVNNSLTSGFFDTIASEILGEQGLTLSINSSDELLNKKAEKAYFDWERNCCPYGVYDFEDLEEMALISYYRDGEVFVHFVRSNDGLKIEILDANLIDSNYTDDKENVKCGIQREKNSLKPLFYYLRKEGNTIKTQLNEVIKIPADDIIHIKKTLIPQQRRGISRLASAVMDINGKDKFLKAERDRARLASEITGFITNKADDGLLEFNLDGESEEVKNKIATVGELSYLNSNEDIKFADTHAPDNIVDYLKMTDREVARGLGVSYATLTGDLREVNYSSIRQGVTSERRSFRRLQGFLRRKFHEPIFKEWLKSATITKIFTPAEHSKILNSFSYKPQGWEYIDPTKEVNANKVSIENGFKTISEVLREKGVEMDSFLKDLDADKIVIQKLSEINKIRNKNEN